MILGIILGCLFFGLFSCDVYKGSKFPVKYLDPDDVVPTDIDLAHYISTVMRIVDYYNKDPNSTDVNSNIGLFYMKSVLKRTLKENGHKINDEQRSKIKEVIEKGENVVSHFTYSMKPIDWEDLAARVSVILQDDEPEVYSIGDFNRNRLKKIILSDTGINKYDEAFDTASMPKEEYAYHLEDLNHNFTIDLSDSDMCLSWIVFNAVPENVKQLRPCTAYPDCGRVVYKSPSISYYLSHRMLNIIMPRHIRRCYFRSPEKDAELVDVLCASMYRETVYLHRRGFFFKDLFLEHIALCGLQGYEEFHRRHWFYKAASWVDKNGCIKENRNFILNRTKIAVALNPDEEIVKARLEIYKNFEEQDCHTHQMALASVVMAHAIRYTAHFGVTKETE